MGLLDLTASAPGLQPVPAVFTHTPATWRFVTFDPVRLAAQVAGQREDQHEQWIAEMLAVGGLEETARRWLLARRSCAAADAIVERAVARTQASLAVRRMRIAALDEAIRPMSRRPAATA